MFVVAVTGEVAVAAESSTFDDDDDDDASKLWGEGRADVVDHVDVNCCGVRIAVDAAVGRTISGGGTTVKALESKTTSDRRAKGTFQHDSIFAQ